MAPVIRRMSPPFPAASHPRRPKLFPPRVFAPQSPVSAAGTAVWQASPGSPPTQRPGRSSTSTSEAASVSPNTGSAPRVPGIGISQPAGSTAPGDRSSDGQVAVPTSGLDNRQGAPGRCLRSIRSAMGSTGPSASRTARSRWSTCQPVSGMLLCRLGSSSEFSPGCAGEFQDQGTIGDQCVLHGGV